MNKKNFELKLFDYKGSLKKLWANKKSKLSSLFVFSFSFIISAKISGF